MRPSVLWTLLWLGLVAVVLATRPLLPMDETRYLSVAWEMMQGGDFLVPHLNGETYSHKPPLMFWLIDLGWAAFGVNETWARLVVPLMGLANLFLTAAIGGRLWPQAPERGQAAAFVLCGALFFTLFGTLTFFDLMLGFCALVGLLGLLMAWREGGWKGFGLVALGIGLGILAKGPAILLHILPVALAAPWWAPRLAGPGRPWKAWYQGLGLAVLAGAAIGLAWAVPAGIAGGEDYRRAIFWGQSAGRVVDSFAHKRGWWWYLAVLPGLLLPWTLWPPLWRAQRRWPDLLSDGAVRFCLVWFLSALVVFSLISGKQLHYLLPEFPAIALLAARLIDGQDSRRLDRIAVGGFGILVGVAMLLEPVAERFVRVPDWLEGMDAGWGLLPVAAGLALILRPMASPLARAAGPAALSVLLVASAHLAAMPELRETFDLEPLARRLAQWEKEGYVLAHYGKYHGQFHFLGRLEKPMAAVGDGEIADWLAATSKGKVVTYHRVRPTEGNPDLVRQFRRSWIAVWDIEEVRRDPNRIKRLS
ncbi:MAG: glycosyltransferase family 39 protein [Magnetospirillum sp. WYHS-4]